MIAFFCPFQFFFPIVTHCVLPLISLSPLPRALLEQSFAELKNLFPAGTSPIRLFSLKETAFKHNSNPSQLRARKAVDQQYQKTPVSRDQESSFLYLKTHSHCLANLDLLKKNHHKGNGACLVANKASSKWDQR